MARKSRKNQIAEMHLPKTIQQNKVDVVFQTGIYARKSVDEEKKGNGNESILTQVSMLERYVETHVEFQLVGMLITVLQVQILIARNLAV